MNDSNSNLIDKANSTNSLEELLYLWFYLEFEIQATVVISSIKVRAYIKKSEIDLPFQD